MIPYQTGSLEPDEVDTDSIDFSIDTALSWDGDFPPIGAGDFLIEVGTVDGDRVVLVSRRYTDPVNESGAAEIALGAVAERYGFETDDEGDLIEIMGEEGLPAAVPAWIAKVSTIVEPTPGGVESDEDGEYWDPEEGWVTVDARRSS